MYKCIYDYVTLDLDVSTPARFQPFQVSHNHDGYCRFSGFSSIDNTYTHNNERHSTWADCINVTIMTIVRSIDWLHPLNDATEDACVLD